MAESTAKPVYGERMIPALILRNRGIEAEAVYGEYVHRSVFGDPPVLAARRRWMIWRLVRDVHGWEPPLDVRAADVVVVEVTPEDLQADWEKHRVPGLPEEYPMRNAGALIAYVPCGHFPRNYAEQRAQKAQKGCDSQGCNDVAVEVLMFRDQPGHVHDCAAHAHDLREFCDVTWSAPLVGECPVRGCDCSPSWFAQPRPLQSERTGQ